MVWSLVLLFKNLWSEVENFMGPKKYIVAGVTVTGHATLVLSAILYFFN
jgi:hypothetical protein